MNLIIDGHNLIPHIPGMNLWDIDDEQKLIKWLQDFARIKPANIEVFFDKAPAGNAGTTSKGRVKCIFVASSSTADKAIDFRLQKLGPQAKNYTVISADRAVQQSARLVHAKIMGSAEFVEFATIVIQASTQAPGRDPLLTADEVDDWIELFKKKN